MNLITSTITPGNSVSRDDQADWQRASIPWTVQLRYQGRRYTFPFWTGKGWDKGPATFDAAHCVLSDANGFEHSRCFEDWASEYGYDSDSRKAERIYRASERVHANVKRLLGDDFDGIAYLDEDALDVRCK